MGFLWSLKNAREMDLKYSGDSSTYFNDAFSGYLAHCWSHVNQKAYQVVSLVTLTNQGTDS